MGSWMSRRGLTFLWGRDYFHSNLFFKSAYMFLFPFLRFRWVLLEGRTVYKGFFLWSGLGEMEGDHFVRWECACRSKEEGDLGFGNLVPTMIS